MQIKFVEDANLTGTRITNDGYLVADVRCARVGIQDYSGFEFGMPEKARVRVFRPEDEVFSTSSLSTFVGKPVTDDHPSTPVTSENWKEHARGSIGEGVLRDGDYIKVPITLMDADLIRKVQEGKRELSMGYESSITFQDGTTPDGQSYDAVMGDIKINHIAVVNKGRAGSSVRIGDSWAMPQTKENGKTHMKTIIVDGLSVEVTDAAEIAILKLQRQVKDGKDAAAAASAEHDSIVQSLKASYDAAIATKDAELAAKDAEIVDLKSQVLSDAEIDVKAAARSALITKASKVVKDADFAGKSNLEIKTAAVKAHFGDEFVADKPEAYVTGMFDAIKEPKEPVRDALMGNQPAPQTQDADNGYAAYKQRIADGWKTATTGAAA